MVELSDIDGESTTEWVDIDVYSHSKYSSEFLLDYYGMIRENSIYRNKVKSKEVINENYTIVNSVLVATSNRPEVKIDWRIYTKNPNNPMIRDLIIEGLSLARTQKEEFASILNSNDGEINALFEAFENFSKN